MRDALRRLAQDDWVIGVPAAIGYASVVVQVFGRGVDYQESLGAATTFAVVLLLAAFLLRQARETAGRMKDHEHAAAHLSDDARV